MAVSTNNLGKGTKTVGKSLKKGWKGNITR